MALCSHGRSRQVSLHLHTHYSLHPVLSHADPSWVYAYIDIDAPIVQRATGGGGPEPSPEQIGMLADMGFSAPQARKALRETVCRLDAVQVPAPLTD